jgi:hypothetical protein
MYNWEVALSKSHSQSGTYEIVQITRPKSTNSTLIPYRPFLSSQG